MIGTLVALFATQGAATALAADFRDSVREAQLTIARRDFAQSVYNTILSQLRLQAAVGRLVEADLRNINDSFEPQ